MAMVIARWTSPVAAIQPMNVASGGQVDDGRVKPGGAVGDAPVAARPDSAASISRTISARKESLAAAVAAIVSGPVRLSVPA